MLVANFDLGLLRSPLMQYLPTYLFIYQVSPVHYRLVKSEFIVKIMSKLLYLDHNEKFEIKKNSVFSLQANASYCLKKGILVDKLLTPKVIGILLNRLKDSYHFNEDCVQRLIQDFQNMLV